MRTIWIVVLTGLAGLAGCDNNSEAPIATNATPQPEQAATTVRVGDLQVDVLSSIDEPKAGQANALVVRLPYSDEGASLVRTWIGSPDRSGATVSDGTYNADRNAYEASPTAPAALTPDTRWWIEIEQPDGTRCVGSFAATT